MVLFLHHRYRTTGGEERVVDDLRRLVRERLGEEAELLTRASAGLGPGRAAAGLLGGGLQPAGVAAAVRRTGARVVHAHNLLPTLGWRALAAARGEGARIVLHLHNFRLVCAVGTCFTEGADCTRCHGRDTRPGVRHACRGSRAEGLAYAAGLALWQRRLVAQADAVIVPSQAAMDRLRALGAPLEATRPGALRGPSVHVLAHVVHPVSSVAAPGRGEHALVSSRLAPEKGVDVAIDAAARAGLPLVIAGDGPEEAALRARAAATGASVRFAGRVGAEELADLRARAALAVVPSRSAETFGLAAAEAMAAGLPVVASAIGALTDLLAGEDLVAPGDPAALAHAMIARWGDEHAGQAGRARIHALAAPERIAPRLAAIYAG
ncbi:MAG TPA: glycosyltransferase family 4 protein [Solirubrobacteraceae bacterium]|nr:glycosyltransferase family 4 protein [Solirubrobacteraceae bacterium]